VTRGRRPRSNIYQPRRRSYQKRFNDFVFACVLILGLIVIGLFTINVIGPAILGSTQPKPSPIRDEPLVPGPTTVTSPITSPPTLMTRTYASNTVSNINPAIEQRINELVNEKRREHGLPSLVYDASLSNIARLHSQDMADNGYFSHVNLRGEDPSERASKYNYPIEKAIGGGAYQVGIGENIGKMPTGNVIGVGFVSNNPESVAQAQVDSWMTSPGHRDNILSPQYDKIGIGVAYDGIYYFSTQDFW
jgi:uncharacterized protein YkwD